MKTIIFLMALLILIIISCKEEENITAPNPPSPNIDDTINIQEEINSIRWDKLSGRAIYVKKGKYLLLNTMDRSVKIIGDAIAYMEGSRKCKFDGSLITIMEPDEINNQRYNLVATDLDGNRTRLYPLFVFDTYFYDWLPDGRIVYLRSSGQIYIEGNPLNTDIISSFYSIDCSPAGNKIFVSTRIVKDSSLYSSKILKIVEVDIQTGEQNLIDTNLEAFNPQIIEMKCSQTTGKFLYIVKSYSMYPSSVSYALFHIPNILIGHYLFNPNWSPFDGTQLTYTSYTDTYLRNSYSGTEVLVIPGGLLISWFN